MCLQRIPQSRWWAEKNFFFLEVLITPEYGDCKIRKPIARTSGRPTRTLKRNCFRKLEWRSSKTIPITKLEDWPFFVDELMVKTSSKCKANSLTYHSLFPAYLKIINTIPTMAIIFHASSKSSFMKMHNVRKKILHWRNQGKHFVQGCFRNKTYFRHLFHVFLLAMPFLFFLVFSRSKSFKSACYLREFHLQITLSLINYSFITHTPHMPCLFKIYSVETLQEP